MALDGEVNFSFTIEDNVTPVTDKMAASQDKLADKAQRTTANFEAQRLKNIECLASLNAFRSGINESTQAMRELGLVDEQTYQSVRKVVAGLTLVTATAEGVKGAVGIMRMLSAATKSYAVASVFATIAANPLLGAAAVAGGAAAAGGFVYMMNNADSKANNQNTTTNNTTINLYSSPSREGRVVSSGLGLGSYY